MNRLTLSLLLLASVVLPAEANDDYITKYFSRVTSDGTHTFATDMNNHYNAGETASIPAEYFMAKYAVTCKEWQEFIQANKLQKPKYWTSDICPEGKASHPVLWVSLDEALAYCEWLSEKHPGYTFRLPTEAEWEYAAIGNTRYHYPWSNESGCEYADGTIRSAFNYNGVYAAHLLLTPDSIATFCNEKSEKYGTTSRIADIISINGNGGVNGWIDHSSYTGLVYTDVFQTENNAGGYTCNVDAYPDGVSPFGCYNMSGNCWEWTTTVAEAVNGAEKGQMVNVIRGGSWYATSKSCRATFRGEGRKASGKYATVGLRIVAERNDATKIDNIPEIQSRKAPDVYHIDGKKSYKTKKRHTFNKRSRSGNVTFVAN